MTVGELKAFIGDLEDTQTVTIELAIPGSKLYFRLDKATTEENGALTLHSPKFYE